MGTQQHQRWEVPGRATRALLATPISHVLPAIARTARAMGLSVEASARMLDIVDERGGRWLDRLLARLAHELTDAETRVVRVVTDPPADDVAFATALLNAPTLATELARRGITVEIGVLAEAEFWSVYQPIVSLADRAKVAHEALLRGLVDGREVPGGDLFFVASSAGWLHRLDRIGREAAVTGAAGWLGGADLFVNVSPRAIYRAQVCLASTERAAHDAGLAPSQLVLEVAEADALADQGHLHSVLEHVRAVGFRVALADVGAGWSSRSLLSAVRPDVVKLDKALVRLLPDDRARAMIRAVVEQAHGFGAAVVAEGVEHERLAQEVAGLGADLGQGWLFGRPSRPRAAVEEPVNGWQPVSAAPTR
ncbi:EAL domain-containing protein [Geodermatophilus sp. SYSU D00815]